MMEVAGRRTGAALESGRMHRENDGRSAADESAGDDVVLK